MALRLLPGCPSPPRAALAASPATLPFAPRPHRLEA